MDYYSKIYTNSPGNQVAIWLFALLTKNYYIIFSIDLSKPFLSFIVAGLFFLTYCQFKLI